MRALTGGARILVAVAFLVVSPKYTRASVVYIAGADLLAHEVPGDDETILPNGAWTYGTAPEANSGFVQYGVAQHVNWPLNTNFQGWSDLDSNLTSIIAVNTADTPQKPCCNIGFFDPGKIFMHPSVDLEVWAVVRWTAPAGGTVSIAAEWTQMGGGAASREVVHNGISLSGSEGYGTGNFNHPGLAVLAGDTIDFSLGPQEPPGIGPSPWTSTATQFDAMLEFSDSSSVVYGDYNGNGVVDAADYTVWRNNLGQLLSLPGESPSAITPGYVDDEDFNFWKANFGNTAGLGSASIATVPEPSIWALSGSMLLCLGRRRNMCRSQLASQHIAAHTR